MSATGVWYTRRSAQCFFVGLVALGIHACARHGPVSPPGIARSASEGKRDAGKWMGSLSGTCEIRNRRNGRAQLRFDVVASCQTTVPILFELLETDTRPPEPQEDVFEEGVRKTFSTTPFALGDGIRKLTVRVSANCLDRTRGEAVDELVCD